MRSTGFVALAGLAALAACNDAPAGEPTASEAAATPSVVATAPADGPGTEASATPLVTATPSEVTATSTASPTPSASPSPVASAAPAAAASPRAGATAARAAPSPASPAPAATVAAASAPAGNAARGKALFNDWSCGSCHALADAGATGSIGPSLDRNSKLTRDYVTNIVTNGQGAMPSFAGQMTDAEIAAVAAYIVSAKR